MSAVERLKMQSLATCNNYYHTGQYRKAISVLNQTLKIFPDDEIARTLLNKVYQVGFSIGDILVMDGQAVDTGLEDVFGKNWAGEPLNNKSIMIFCDQGMGDMIQMLRYVDDMSRSWNCTIHLNYYAFFNEMEALMRYFSSAQFTKDYIKTDFHTNILSIASILNGLDYECHYPAHHRALLNTTIPKTTYFEDVLSCPRGKIGLAWKTNAKNPLSLDKSIELELFRELGCTFQNLLPERVECDFLAQREPVSNLLDTAERIASCGLVISVDTAVLHLAGVMGVPTWGLLCKEADPRWGEGETTPWYPSMRLYRQTTDWPDLIHQVKKDLETWQNQK